LRLSGSGLKGVDDQPARSATDVDQLLGGQPGPRTQIGEVAFRGARPDARASSGMRYGSAGFNVGREHLQLASCRVLGEFAPKAVVAHAPSPAAASHSSRPSIGIS
jgi:hypothetical protein